MTAVVTTRHGGVSVGSYHSLNLGDHVGDDHEAVLENRARVAATLGVDRLTIADQQHGNRVAVVDKDTAGRGHDGDADAAVAFPATDALITNRPGIALAILVADCAPIVLYDPVNRAIGVAHSGRVGTMRAIVPTTIAAMTDAFGTTTRDLEIGIGPAIGPASYEIGSAEAADLTAALGPEATGFLHENRPGHALFDLPGAIRAQLARAGVPAHRMHDLAIDTKTATHDFFSDRAARPCGRFAAIAMLT